MMNSFKYIWWSIAFVVCYKLGMKKAYHYYCEKLYMRSVE